MNMTAYGAATYIRCNRKQTEAPATGHTEEVLPAKAPTCTEPGLTEGKKCSVCETILTAQQEVPANGHTEETLPAKAPTCTETGLTEGKKCSVCETILTVQLEVPANGHIPLEAVQENVVEVIPCQSDGSYDSVVYCDACGAELSRTKVVIPAHQYEKVEEAFKPTCTDPGRTELLQCKDCGAEKGGDEIPALGGDHTYENGVCTRCGAEEPVSQSGED